MRAHLFVRLVLGLAALQCGLASKAASEVDPSVTYVISEGYWQHTGRAGTFRVVVYAGGYQYIWNTVVAEWVAEPKNEDDSTSVLVKRNLLSAYRVSLGPPVFELHPNRVRVTLSGTETTAPYKKKITCVFDLLAEGTVRVVRECS